MRKRNYKIILYSICLLASVQLVKAFGRTDEAMAADKVNIQVSESSSWESNGSQYSQWNFTITNHSESLITSWQVQLPVSAGFCINQIWDATGKVESNTLTCSPMSHNTMIAAGGSLQFGGIFENANNLDGNAARLTYTIQNSGNSTYSTTSPDAIASNTSHDAQTGNTTANDWLYTKGNAIVNRNGTKVWLTGLNWFGYNTGTNCLDGLWNADLKKSVESIANKGFNLIRVPISSELVLNWKKGVYPKANYNTSINSYLNGKNSLEILDYFVSLCRTNGIKIMFDIHSAKTDPMGHQYPVWYNGSITEANYISSLTWLAKRYKNDDTVVAYDLKNEPHGGANDTTKAIWNGSTAKNNWRYISQKAALKVLEVNPNVLVLVAGTEIYPRNSKGNADYSSKNASDYYYTWWGANLRGVKKYPVQLGKYQNKLVYTAHDYGPTVYNQPWFQKNYTYNSLMKDCWRDNWFYIHEQKIAPVLIGEWGGYMTEPNLKWMTYMRKLIKSNRLNHTFWCFNANSGDTGGLVKDDFTTWDMKKYNFVKQVLWQSYGSFVGLDSEIPLGKNGITIATYEKQTKKAAEFEAVTKKSKPVLYKGKKVSPTKVRLKWKKYSKANGYVLYMSNNKNKGYKAIKTIRRGTTLSYEKSGLTKGRTYYFKVKAYCIVGKKRIYSKYSTVRTIKL